MCGSLHAVPPSLCLGLLCCRCTPRPGACRRPLLGRGRGHHTGAPRLPLRGVFASSAFGLAGAASTRLPRSCQLPPSPCCPAVWCVPMGMGSQGGKGKEFALELRLQQAIFAVSAWANIWAGCNYSSKDRSASSWHSSGDVEVTSNAG